MNKQQKLAMKEQRKRDNDRKIQLHVDKTEYKEKPIGKDIAGIQKRITNELMSVTVRELANCCVAGKTIKAGVFPKGQNKSEKLICIQLLALDFDNVGEDKQRLEKGYVSKRDIFNRDFTKRYGAFMYDTFSSTEGHERFRLIFVLNEAITNPEDFKLLYNKLREIYPESDSKTTDVGRLFFGGRNLREVKYQNVIEVSSLLPEIHTLNSEELGLLISEEYQNPLNKSEKEQKKDTITEDTDIWKILKNGRNRLACQKVLNTNREFRKYLDINREFESYDEALNYFKSVNLQKFLEFPRKQPFKSPFRKDNDPSVSIFKSNKEDVWLYKDFGNNKVYNIITLLQENILPKKLGNYGFQKPSQRDVVTQLLELTSCTVKKTKKQLESIEFISKLELVLHDPEIESKNPYLNKVINKKKYDNLIIQILRKFENSVYDENGETYHISWFSSVRLSKEFSTSDNKITTTRIKHALIMMCATGILKNYSDDKIPKELLAKLNDTRESYIKKDGRKVARQKKQDRRSNVHEINDSISLEAIELRCQKLYENGYSIRNLNKEWFLRYFDKEVADKVFPQIIDTKRGISHESQEFESVITRISEQLYGARGVVVISKLKGIAFKNFGYSDNKFDKHWTRIRKDFCEKYDFDEGNVRKDLRSKLGITEKYAKSKSKILISTTIDMDEKTRELKKFKQRLYLLGFMELNQRFAKIDAPFYPERISKKYCRLIYKNELHQINLANINF